MVHVAGQPPAAPENSLAQLWMARTACSPAAPAKPELANVVTCFPNAGEAVGCWFSLQAHTSACRP